MQSKPHLQPKGIAVLGVPAWFVSKGSKAVVQCPGIVTVVQVGVHQQKINRHRRIRLPVQLDPTGKFLFSRSVVGCEPAVVPEAVDLILSEGNSVFQCSFLIQRPAHGNAKTFDVIGSVCQFGNAFKYIGWVFALNVNQSCQCIGSHSQPLRASMHFNLFQIKGRCNAALA